MSARAWTRATAMAVIATGVCAVTALPAYAQAEVVRPPHCGWMAEEEGGESLPGTGITEFVDASFCQIVFTPSDSAPFILRGTAPEGYEGDRAVIDRSDGNHTVVTPSGRIKTTGKF